MENRAIRKVALLDGVNVAVSAAKICQAGHRADDQLVCLRHNRHRAQDK